MRYGYACINLSLDDVKVNRGMVKRTFLSKGLEYVSELSYKNLIDLEKIIHWNIENGIKAYRMSSDMFPWMSEYNFNDLPNIEKIKEKLKDIGSYCRKNNHRLSYHPGPFNVLGSPKQNVVDNTISELNKHSEIFDLMGFDANHNTKINIHVGGAYGDKLSTTKRFCENYNKLDEHTKNRLTVENDDKESLYTVKDLYDLIHKNIGIPIVFDYHHHTIKNDGMNEKDALDIATSTWKDIEPVVHFSSPKKIYENIENDNKIKMQSHADFIYDKINTYGKDLCIIFESKAKDLSLLKYNEKFNIL